MTHRIVIMLVALVATCLSLKAQMISFVGVENTEKGQLVDSALLKVQYKASILTDTTLDQSKAKEEILLLEIGRKASLFYSYSLALRDSVLASDAQRGASIEERTNHAKQYGGGAVTYRIYKNYPSGKVSTFDQMGINKYRCEEDNEKPQWALHADTATILSYKCQKATCRFKGRSYEAWYTLEVPISEGPWKLTGLPGLIIKASDKSGAYTFECSGIEKVKTSQGIHLPGGKGYEAISRKEMNSLYERFTKDPIGFIQSSFPGAHITVSGDSKPLKNIPYNPIELSE